MSGSQDQGSGLDLDVVVTAVRAKHELEANTRVNEYILGRIPRGETLTLFLSAISKRAEWNIPTMAVCSTREGAILVYNPDFLNSLTDAELEFVFMHEFLHLATDTFRRSILIRESLAFDDKTFVTKVAPYFDIIVNDMIMEMDGASTLNNKHGMLCSSSSDVPNFLRNQKTLESLSTKIKENLEDVPEKSGITEEYVLANSDASEEESDEIMGMVEKVLGDSGGKGLPGNASQKIRKILEDPTINMNRNSKLLWSKITRSIRSSRAAALQRKRSMRRINRRTLLPPGRINEKGFNVLFVLDESGSIPDNEIKFCFSMVEHAALGDKSDVVYLMHWDTQLLHLDKISKGQKPNLERKGTGGTNFKDMFSEKEVANLPIDLTIVLTDGDVFGNWPEKQLRCQTIWLLTENYGLDNWQKQYAKGLSYLVPKGFMQ